MNLTNGDTFPAVTLDAYNKLVEKAAALDILINDIKSKIDDGASDFSLVDDNLVLIVTGMKAYQRSIQKNDENDEDAE